MSSRIFVSAFLALLISTTEAALGQERPEDCPEIDFRLNHQDCYDVKIGFNQGGDLGIEPRDLVHRQYLAYGVTFGSTLSIVGSVAEIGGQHPLVTLLPVGEQVLTQGNPWSPRPETTCAPLTIGFAPHHQVYRVQLTLHSLQTRPRFGESRLPLSATIRIHYLRSGIKTQDLPSERSLSPFLPTTVRIVHPADDDFEPTTSGREAAITDPIIGIEIEHSCSPFVQIDDIFLWSDPSTIKLYSWYHPGFHDNYATTDPRWAGAFGDLRTPEGAVGTPGMPNYEFRRAEGLIFRADKSQPPGTVPVYTWYSASRDDYFLTSHPGWRGGPGDTRSPDYSLVRHEGYIFDPDQPPPAGAIPLYAWYDHGRGDNYATSDRRWAGINGIADKAPDYRYVRREGYVIPCRFTELAVPVNFLFEYDRTDPASVLSHYFLYISRPVRHHGSLGADHGACWSAAGAVYCSERGRA